ncbi:hypothetical protein [Rhodocista pekingensis]|uniref:Uncharacterized protein n=1 Tax=Rhodocista pekingensis TaxID=201185 RepID=A0ABW2KT31_9PROT
MVETRPTLPGSPRTGGPIPDGERRAGTVSRAEAPAPAVARGRPGNRWPSARELAALMVDGILRLPARYRRGMFLDVIV